jgi:MFS family permease
MGLGQVLFAVAPSYGTALFARALLGCGDAMTFISVLRFMAVRFSARRYPALVAVTSMVGTVGNVLATLPLALALHRAGWLASFAIAGSLSLVAAALVWVFLHDPTVQPSRVRDTAELRRGVGAVLGRVAASWALPGTRLGFWVHFSCMSSATAFGVLWGYPYLVDGVGLGTSAASAVLMAGVLASGAVGPIVGWVVGRHPAMRIVLALGVCTVTVVGWLVTVFVLGDHPPQAYIAALLVVTMFGGPASLVAFAVVRDYNRASIIGTASGVVNVGGFLATVVVVVAFGWTLNLLGGSTPHNLRVALLVPIAVQVFGVVRMVVWYRRVRAAVLQRQRNGQPVPVAVARRQWWDLPEPAPMESFAAKG